MILSMPPSVRTTLALVLLSMASTLPAAEPSKPVTCEGTYPYHLQGVCSNGTDALYWSWTTEIVKTNLAGHVIKKVTAPTHQGDLCHHDGKVYVAVNLGKFNAPAGQADSWVFVYDGDTLAEHSRHPVPEVVHGAGGMAYQGGRFIIIGGLPEGVNENYLYEYDLTLKFQKRHVLASGHTYKGIQTIEHSDADGSWWFGCYGKPAILLRADKDFGFTGRWEFDASFGIIHTGDGRFLLAKNKNIKAKDAKAGSHTATLLSAHADPEKGFVFDTP